MSALLILEDVELPPTVLEAFRAALAPSPIRDGSLMIGWLKHMPDTVYLLWTTSGCRPVTMTTPIQNLSVPEQAKVVAREFVEKWEKERRVSTH